MGKLFAYAVPWTSTKASQRVWVNLIAFTLPSLWPEYIWILEVLGVVVISSRLDIDDSSFPYWNILNVIVGLCSSPKIHVGRPKHSCGFVLDPINVDELL